MADWYDFNPVAIDKVDDILKKREKRAKKMSLTVHELYLCLTELMEENKGDYTLQIKHNSFVDKLYELKKGVIVEDDINAVILEKNDNYLEGYLNMNELI